MLLPGPWAPVPAVAQTLSATTHTEAAPSDLAEPLVRVLGAGGLRVTLAQVAIDFWWAKAVLPVAGNRSAAAGIWRDVAEGTLIGAMRLTGPVRDLRGRTLKPGVYTLRFALQPVNGDHIGVSPYREFLLASPAAADQGVDPPGHEGTVSLSRQAVGASHPAVFSVDPLATTAAPGTVTTNEAGHEAIVVEIPMGAGRALRFGLVLVGRIEA